MGFLDRIGANKVDRTTGEAAGIKKPNPLAARKNPLAARKPSIPLKPAVEKAEEVKEEVLTAPVEEVTVTTTEVAVEEVEMNQQNAAIEYNEQALEAQKKKEAEEDEAIASETEEKAEEVPVEETTTEEEQEPEVVEVKKEEKPKAAAPKKNNRRSAAKKKEVAHDETEEETTFYEIPTTDMDYAEAVEAIRSPFRDQTWEAFREEIQNDLAGISVADDLNPGALKVVISELSILRDKIWFPLQEARTEFERYASKEPEGLIERVKRINSGSGNNETERRRSGILACMSYETPAGAVNLYELMDESRERYAFLKAVDESIKFKKDILITMNGALKLEKDLM